jgi:molybdopterin molybdotransferase
MHGFSRRSEVPAVLEWIDRHTIRLGAETCRSTTRPDASSPPTSCLPSTSGIRSRAMDGYALRGAETSGASEYNPLASGAGQAMPGVPFAGLSGHVAIRIMTGRRSDGPRRGGARGIRHGVGGESRSRGRRARPARGRRGEDIATGAAALAAGRRLRPQDVGLIASLGMARVSVVERPRVRLLVTGNEVKAPGEPKDPYQIYDANSAMLRGLVARDGGVLESHHRLGDDPETIRAALLAAGADVILVSGGSKRWKRRLRAAAHQ